MPRGAYRSGIFWPPSTPAVTGPQPEAQLRINALYYDLYEEILSAGNIDGTDCTDENALRDVLDTNSDMTMDGEDLVLDASSTNDDPCIWYTTLGSAGWETWNGYAHYWRFKIASGPGHEVGLDTDTIADLDAESARLYLDDEGGGIWRVYVNWADAIVYFPDDEEVSFLIVRRHDSEGYYYYYRTDGNWTLFWMDEGPLKSA